ncbi:MAG TPA: cytochrome c oxidase assembly protein [Alphaproteobacteria bacterium]|nr:cytochrome c oxidase assembly protein [Alphaproteobacteria bacterium]
MKRPDKNTTLLFSLAVGVGLMIGLAYASVPLYSLFCKATGFGGTPKRVEQAAAPTPAAERYVTVTFDGNVDPALPWEFAPETKSLRVKLGEQATVNYRATNKGDKTLVGTATFNVQPDKAGAYFDKIQCFCFTKQVLKPGQSEDMAVQFYVDPELAKDPKNDDVQNITLSYTFFLAKDQGKAHAKQASTESSLPNP